MKRLKQLLSIAIVALMSSANAQEIIALKDAVNFALENKADAKRANLAIKKAEYKIDEARAGALPQVSACLLYTSDAADE